MKVRNLVSKRFKETPADCVIASQALMMRGGYIKPVGNGIFTLFPITKRITAKIENIIRQEMNRIDHIFFVDFYIFFIAISIIFCSFH